MNTKLQELLKSNPDTDEEELVASREEPRRTRASGRRSGRIQTESIAPGTAQRIIWAESPLSQWDELQTTANFSSRTVTDREANAWAYPILEDDEG